MGTHGLRLPSQPDSHPVAHGRRSPPPSRHRVQFAERRLRAGRRPDSRAPRAAPSPWRSLPCLQGSLGSTAPDTISSSEGNVTRLAAALRRPSVGDDAGLGGWASAGASSASPSAPGPGGASCGGFSIATAAASSRGPRGHAPGPGLVSPGPPAVSGHGLRRSFRRRLRPLSWSS